MGLLTSKYYPNLIATFGGQTGLMPFMQLTSDNKSGDQLLVERVLRGDTPAFKTIIDQTEGLVAQIVCKMVHNREDMRDIVQDVYMKAFHKLDGFRFQSKLSTWIGQIAYNTCLSYLEKKKLVLPGNPNNDDKNCDEWMDRLQLASDPFYHEPFAQLSQKELTGILKKEIDKLPPVYKLLITLYHNEDRSYHEIGAIMSLPEGTVKSYLFRARKMLRDSLVTQHKKEAL